MKKITSHSKNSLFLMEMILILLFLSLSGAACIHVFSAAVKNRQYARELRHMQELTTSVGEILNGTDGTAGSILKYLPEGTEKQNFLNWYYDSGWNTCPENKAVYQMELQLKPAASSKAGTLTFYKLSSSDELFKIDLAFPMIQSRKQEEEP